MNEINDDFGSALEEALASSHAFQDALAIVSELVEELSETVAAKLPGLSVKLVERGELTLGDKFVGAMHTLSRVMNPRPRRLGDDTEDKETNLLVVTVVGAEVRVLWELDFAARGFPVTVRGPIPGESHYCRGEEELRQAFVAALATTIVGRKLSALSRTAAEVKPDKLESTSVQPE